MKHRTRSTDKAELYEMGPRRDMERKKRQAPYLQASVVVLCLHWIPAFVAFQLLPKDSRNERNPSIPSSTSNISIIYSTSIISPAEFDCFAVQCD